jgi:hypothetical protein
MPGSQLTKTINYTEANANAGHFSYDENKLEVSSGNVAQLILNDSTGLTFSQSFSSDSGFTYNSSYTEFSGGVLQQKDTRPSGATFFASYDSDINGNWGGGTLTGTGTGSPTIVSSALDLTGGTKYVSYTGQSNASSAQTLCVRMTITPNYSGSPATKQGFFAISKVDSTRDNGVLLDHDTGGNILIAVYNDANAQVFSTNFGAWSPTAGVTYEFEYNMDLTTGATRLFIDGAQKGSTIVTTGTRNSANINLFRIGNTWNGTLASSNFKVGYVVVFSAVQHTANYSAPSTVPNSTIYVADIITMPTFTYSDVGDIQGFTAISTTEGGNSAIIRFTLNGKYRTGVAWLTSDGTYAQSTQADTLHANIATFNGVADTLAVKVFTTSSNLQGILDTFTATYTGQAYVQTNPAMIQVSAQGVGADGLVSFSATQSDSSPATVKYQLSVDGTYKYWNGSAWATSDGTLSQSNTAAEINTNAGSLDLSAGVSSLLVRALFSSDGQTRATLTTVSFDYNFFVASATPSECVLYMYVQDILGEEVSDVELSVSLETGFFYSSSSNWIGAYERRLVPNSEGLIESSFVETNTDTKKYRFKLYYKDLSGQQQVYDFGYATVPNQASQAIGSLSFGTTP